MISPIRRPVYLLALDCGHTACALEAEEHAVGRRRPCLACGSGQWSLIETRKKLYVTLSQTEEKDAA